MKGIQISVMTALDGEDLTTMIEKYEAGHNGMFVDDAMDILMKFPHETVYVVMQDSESEDIHIDHRMLPGRVPGNTMYPKIQYSGAPIAYRIKDVLDTLDLYDVSPFKSLNDGISKEVYQEIKSISNDVHESLFRVKVSLMNRARETRSVLISMPLANSLELTEAMYQFNDIGDQ